jgi:hypothetical protein
MLETDISVLVDNSRSLSSLSLVIFKAKLTGINVARVQAQGKNSGPASKARYFVLSAFAHERGILIGCLLVGFYN